MATITCVSKWIHATTGKVCKVIGIRETNSHEYEFHIEGYNPLPCFSFKGTYGILAKWLEENGWYKLIKADFSPDIIIIQHK